MPKTPKKHCIEIRPDGNQCKAYQAKGTEYCVGHARQRGLLELKPESDDPGLIERAPAVSVDEPEALKALRAMQVQIELGGGVDQALAIQLSNILRPYLGIEPMGGVELAKVIDSRMAADEQVAASHAAKMELIDKSHGLIIEHPDEDARARVEARVARDIEDAATNYRARTDQMKMILKKEPREAVYGSGESEIYMVNGVKVVVPAQGVWSVPKTIASMHRERARQRNEKRARSDLMQSVPEYTEVYRGMAEIDRTFGSRSQLGGGPEQEQDDFLVAEEIK